MVRGHCDSIAVPAAQLYDDSNLDQGDSGLV
eukprot:CAMPEP_0114573206 /NCGR_PEP_ID=MMETSP0114-20121206/18739_1 /TAXON_ID=31324 /ORGANISM="Goniomonas sp, Strain m" /LENGTH=30 /DNA_ID= /DNA_START= /DNA_END= /DNA_ORIENTATION=